MKATRAGSASPVKSCTRFGSGCVRERDRIVAVAADDRAAMIEASAADLQRVRDVGEIRRWCPSRDDASSFCAARSRPSASRAESTSNCSGATRRGTRSACGASSSTTCAFVPPTPNELTPARRGVGPSGQSRCARARRRTACARSRASDSAIRNCMLAGRILWCSASAALIRPATPAATSRCPMFHLIEPIAQKPLLVGAAGAECLVSPAISIGSPSACRCRAPRCTRSSPDRCRRASAPSRSPARGRRRSAP